MSDELELSDGSFEAETAKGVVLVDFWAPWCGPCRMQAPILDNVARLSQGWAKIAKCNVDEAPGSAMRMGIRGIPTLVIFKDGREVDRMVGVQTEQVLLERLRFHSDIKEGKK